MHKQQGQLTQHKAIPISFLQIEATRRIHSLHLLSKAKRIQICQALVLKQSAKLHCQIIHLSARDIQLLLGQKFIKPQIVSPLKQTVIYPELSLPTVTLKLIKVMSALIDQLLAWWKTSSCLVRKLAVIGHRFEIVIRSSWNIHKNWTIMTLLLPPLMIILRGRHLDEFASLLRLQVSFFQSEDTIGDPSLIST